MSSQEAPPRTSHQPPTVGSRRWLIDQDPFTGCPSIPQAMPQIAILCHHDR
ncbi:hypothetical protein ACFPN7_48295 [Amycolatopsis halotolerans]|uniref:hypothetical protein n=1 Tax=Amycolatopsis halotolerans TaxID=330083 RepID=UPI0036092017